MFSIILRAISQYRLERTIEQYEDYKQQFGRNIQFESGNKDGGEKQICKHVLYIKAGSPSPVEKYHHTIKLITCGISEKELNYTIQLVKIYLSSATFDEIEKEMKVISPFKMIIWHSFPILIAWRLSAYAELCGC